MSRLPDPFDPGRNVWVDSGNSAPVRSDSPEADAAEPLDRAVETAVMRGLFGEDRTRRAFLKTVGKSVAASAISASFPLAAAKAAAREKLTGKLEKTSLQIGYVPITCSAPLIAAQPMGFYERTGLQVNLVRTAGWAAARDKCLSGEFDASHLLAPMPLAMTMGLGSDPEDFVVPAIQNTNGQALVLSRKHLNRRDPKTWRGFRLAVPFEYSMHNFLLRFYLASHGLDPDSDVEIRVIPPPEMVASLGRGSVDGYLAPDPYCQRAVHDEVGFIHLLSKHIMPQHPCCAFGCPREFVRENPNTFLALYQAVLEAIEFCGRHENRLSVAAAIHGEAYLDQPLSVVEQVMTGTYADGLGGVQHEPDRIHFAPLPTQAMAGWILDQMKHWGYLKSDEDYSTIARRVYLSTGVNDLIRELNTSTPVV